MSLESVARNRMTSVERVEAEFGLGRIVSDQDAVLRGVADRVGTVDEAVREDSRRGGSPGRLTVEFETCIAESATETDDRYFRRRFLGSGGIDLSKSMTSAAFSF
jgi:ClpP class serine protease